MRKIFKNRLKQFGIPVLLITLIISSIPISNVNAETPEVTIVNSSDDKLEYTVETNDGEISVSAESVDDNITESTVEDDNGDTYNFTFYTDSGEIYLDGELTGTIEEYKDPNEIAKQSRYVPTPEGGSGTSTTAVYVSSYKVNFTKTFTKIATAVTVAGVLLGVLTVVSLTVFPVVASVLSANIAQWIGATVSIAGITGVMKGYWNYALYRTPKTYNTISGPQYQYRYQNSKLSFSALGYNFAKSYTQVGPWWYAHKPY
jgi:hypothetical protein